MSKTARVQFRPSTSAPYSFRAQVRIGGQQSGIANLNFAGADVLADFPIDWPATPGIYDVKVDLLTAAGDLVWEKIAGQVVVPVTVPPAPVPMLPANGSVVYGTSITFTWAAVAGATNYCITVVRPDGTYLVQALSVGNVTSYTVNGFPNDGTMYYWSVAAYDSAGWGTWEQNWSFTNGATVKGITITGCSVLGGQEVSVVFPWVHVNVYSVTIHNPGAAMLGYFGDTGAFVGQPDPTLASYLSPSFSPPVLIETGTNIYRIEGGFENGPAGDWHLDSSLTWPMRWLLVMASDAGLTDIKASFSGVLTAYSTL